MMAQINDAQTVSITIREHIKSLISRNNLTVRKFAAKCGVSRFSVDAWLNRGQIPSGYSLYSICAAFDVSADWLLGLNERR